MFGFVLFLHTLICVLLIAVILMQSGRGGGLTEAFSAAESMFGAKTSSVLVQVTAFLTAAFLLTSLSLAFLSSQKDKSLMMGSESQRPVGQAVEQPLSSQSTDQTKSDENTQVDKRQIQPTAVPGEPKNP